jgi:hypothetical protein
MVSSRTEGAAGTGSNHTDASVPGLSGTGLPRAAGESAERTSAEPGVSDPAGAGHRREGAAAEEALTGLHGLRFDCLVGASISVPDWIPIVSADCTTEFTSLTLVV